MLYRTPGNFPCCRAPSRQPPSEIGLSYVGEVMGFACGQPILVPERTSALRTPFNIMGDDGEIRGGGLVGFGAALFPVAPRAERDAAARCTFFLRQADFLRQAERPAQCPDARDAPGRREPGPPRLVLSLRQASPLCSACLEIGAAASAKQAEMPEPAPQCSELSAQLDRIAVFQKGSGAWTRTRWSGCTPT